MSEPEARDQRAACADLLLLFFASRISLLAVGMLSTWLMASGLSVQKGNLVYHRTAPLPLEIWSRWDSEWYLLIAGEGYDATQRFEHLDVAYEKEAAAGFLPLYPLLIRLASPLAGPVGAGVAISNLCLLASLILLYRLVAGLPDGGHEAGLAACTALLVFPTSLFLSAVYAESLFLMLSLASFHSAHRGRIGSASAWAALATLARPAGVLLALPLAWEWFRGPRRTDGPGRWSGVWIGLVPAALGGFMLYCDRAVGDPMAFLHRQSRWRGAMSGPWRAFVRWWESGPAAHGAHDSTVELLTALAVVSMLPFVVRRLPASWGIYATAAVLMPLCSTLWSFGRFALTVFPLFALIGLAWARGRRRLPILYGLAGSTIGGFFMALFANWWWVG